MFFCVNPVFILGFAMSCALAPVRAAEPSPMVTKRKYIGEEHDVDTGLNYLNARYYDPRRGQFLSQDPLSWAPPAEYLLDPQQLNSYSYARNNPITYKDPTGLSTASVRPRPPGGWKIGQAMGQYNGVTAYYNGIGSPSIAYSCVEYAKRYMSRVYGINSIGRVGDAKTMWSMSDTINTRLASTGAQYRFSKYPNGMNALPRSGDLLFWTEGRWGHVMVVTESGFNAASGKGYVEIIDQNASNTAVRKLDVTKTENGYTITRNSGGRIVPVAGWFSPTPVAKESRPSNDFVWRQGTSAPVPQSSGIRDLITSARKFMYSLLN